MNSYGQFKNSWNLMRVKAYTPDLWDVMKMVLKGKLQLQVFTYKLENTQRNILGCYL